MAPGKDQIVLHSSEEFKDALGQWATEHNMSMAEVIRQAVADTIGYDLKAEPARSRTPKYDSPEKAKEAALERAALLRWGNRTSSKLLNDGFTVAATTIARAVIVKDYETLAALKYATTPTGDEETTTDDE